MTEFLSLWRSPLDQVALYESQMLGRRQVRCSIGQDEDFSAMTIFNYTKYVDSAGGDPNAALTNMFAAMAPGPYATGGTAFIQQRALSRNMLASSTGFSVPDQSNLIGSGGGGSLVGSPPPNDFHHFVIDFSGGTIFLSCTGSYTGGGIHFRGLSFKAAMPVPSTNDTCIYAATDSCRAVNCVFTDIPTAFYALGDNCTLEQCTITYDTKDGATAIVIAAAGCGIFGPAEIDQRPQGGANPGPADCTAVSLEGAEQTVIADVHLTDWNIGVDFAQLGGAMDTEIRNCEIQCWQSALNISVPSAMPNQIAGVKVTSCMLAKSTQSTDQSAIVLIDPDGGIGQLSDITLLDCTVFSGAASANAQYGLEIVGGTNVKILGGTYSNNGSVGGAGIAITGACGDIQILGANLQPSYPWAGSVPGSNLNFQQYGLLVTAAPVGTVIVKGCDLTGYDRLLGQQPVNVTVPVAQGLFVENCPGYNDSNTALNLLTPPTSPTAAATCSTPYFGPSVVAFSNPTPVYLTVFGQTVALSFGVIYLPSPYDEISFAAAPSSFSWSGK
ncbi:MAG TPA: hypothetical protein VMU38_01675 [Candidatus Binatia bacterium]|nr:hypothetical protein [Candidatus Binatia bacterium]